MAKQQVNTRIGADGYGVVDNQLPKGYYEKVKKQRETFVKLDSALSVLEILPSLADNSLLEMGLDTVNGTYGLSLSKHNLSFSLSPLGFLFNIVRALGVSEETLREWIVEILMYSLPAVEVGVKATLISNIKAIVSCSSDPRIPIKYRKKTGNSIFNKEYERGFRIPIDAIDPNGILDLSPFTEPGILKYFGCVTDTMYNNVVEKAEESGYKGVLLDKVKSTGNASKSAAKLARADDFNAFLWYVMHKGNNKVPHQVTRENNGLKIKGLGKVNVWRDSNGNIYDRSVTSEWQEKQKEIHRRYDDAYNNAREIIESIELILVDNNDGANVTDEIKNKLKKELMRAYKERDTTHFRNYDNGTNCDKVLGEVDFRPYNYYVKKKEDPFYEICKFPEMSDKCYTLLGAVGIKLVVPDNMQSNGISESTIVQGDTFFEEGSPFTISICVKNIYDKSYESYISNPLDDIEPKVIGHILVPLSSDWFSCNWYVDKSNYYETNLGIKQNKERDFSKEKAICNLRYVKRGEEDSTYYNVDTPDFFNLTILPKPYMMLPSYNLSSTENGEYVQSLRWQPVRLLFDANGNPSQGGNYSFRSEHDESKPPLKYVGTNTSTNEDMYEIRDGNSDKLFVNNVNGEYRINPKSNTNKYLVECYNGLTVYEFNYDYIMGMKLFDPKVICQQLFENSVNPKYNANFSLSYNKIKDKNIYPYFSDKQRLLDMIKNILDEDDEEINDCFYSFTNKQYDLLLEETERLKYNRQPFNQGYNDGESLDFSKVTEILSDYPETGTLVDQKTVINKALEQACGIFAEQQKVVTLADSTTIKVDFMTDMLSKLTMSIVESILSPKILMVLMVNEQLMGGTPGKQLNPEDLFKAMKGVIKGVIGEIRDLILQKILDFVLSTLAPMALKLSAAQQEERSEQYMALIRLLFGWFNIGIMTATRLSSILSSLLSKFRRKHKKHFDKTDIDLPTVLDTVEYADIYDTNKTDDVPKISNC